MPAEALETPLDMNHTLEDDEQDTGGHYIVEDESSMIPAGIEMTLHHKYYFAKSLCASRNLTMDQKQDIMYAVY